MKWKFECLKCFHEFWIDAVSMMSACFHTQRKKLLTSNCGCLYRGYVHCKLKEIWKPPFSALHKQVRNAQKLTQPLTFCWNCVFTVLCLITHSLYLFVHIPYLAMVVHFSSLSLSHQVAPWTSLLSFPCGGTGILTGYEHGSMLC